MNKAHSLKPLGTAVEFGPLAKLAQAMQALSREVAEARSIALVSDRSPQGLASRAELAEKQVVQGGISHQNLMNLLHEGEAALKISQDALKVLSERYEQDKAKFHASEIVVQALTKLNVNSQASLQASHVAFEALSLHHDESQETLKASDVALEALGKINASSEENFKISQEGLLVLRQHLEQTQEHLDAKGTTVAALSKLIDVNKEAFQTSLLAVQTVIKLAFYDLLTDLPNRRLLNDRLGQAVHAVKQHRSHAGVLFLDLDKFKYLNDRYGHAVGDQLLIAVANRLKLQVLDCDTVGRFGGDEFVVIITGLDAEKKIAVTQLRAAAERIRIALSAPYALTIHRQGIADEIVEYQCLASIGVAMIDPSDGSPTNLLDWADEAMYQAKQEGGNTIRLYDPIQSSQATLVYLYGLATAYDIESANHGIRLQQYVQALALRLQKSDRYPSRLTEETINSMIKATPLHDIGKTKIPTTIVQKPGPLNEIEWAIMKTHTTLGEAILGRARKQNAKLDKLLDVATAIAGGHHEWWDASGYPRGLKGEEIPLSARLVAIADVYDALVTVRAYKNQWTHEQAVQAIQEGRGTQFDPDIVDAFMIEQGNFQAIALRYADNPGVSSM